MNKIRMRRNRPSALALALALAITMFAVFLITYFAGTEEDRAVVAAQGYGTADIAMEALQAHLEIYGRYDSALEADVAAAQCLATGGAGICIMDGERYAVVYAAHASDEAYETHAGAESSALVISCGGLTMRANGSGEEIAAISQATDFLRTLAVQTGSLAGSIESGGTDAASMQALISVYLTQGRSARRAIAGFAAEDESARAILASVENSIARLESAHADPSAGNLRRIYAAGRWEWIDLLNGLCAGYV